MDIEEKNMKKNTTFIIVAVVIIIILFVISIATGKKGYEEDLLNINYDVEGNLTSLDQYETDNPVVAMYVKDYGSIVMELYPEVAPNTVNNFISLVKSGFYDGNSFHRLMTNFVLQGGDPEGLGSGGPGYSIKGEFKSNGFENNLSHTKGIISMAREQDNKDSAGSQFFIVLKDSIFLDEEYASFGKVIDGWKNIEHIESSQQVANTNTGKLKKNLTIEKALIDLKGKEYNDVEKVSE